MKLEPVTVIVLPTYADVGAIEVAEGLFTTVKYESFGNVSSVLPIMILIFVCVMAVSPRIITVTVVLLRQVHVDGCDVVDVGLTYALQATFGNDDPVTVTVLNL
jgi:hypothetical protein